MRFEGPYRNPEDLADIYGHVHFSWAIDFFEEGLNSNWLLPNRLYEGCRHGAVPIAMRQTETGRFLTGRGIGVLLDEPSAEGLQPSLGDMDTENYARPFDGRGRGSQHMDLRLHDCRALVDRLKALGSAATADCVTGGMMTAQMNPNMATAMPAGQALPGDDSLPQRGGVTSRR